MKSYNNWLIQTHGISVDRAKPRHAMEYLETKIQAFEKGNASAFSMRQMAHAFHSFRVASAETGTFKHTCKVADKRDMLNTLTERGIFRKSADSTVLKANHSDYEKVQKELNVATTSKHLREDIKTVHELQRYAGMRVHEAVKLKVSDIDFKSGTVYIKGKGGHERTVKIESKELLEKLKNLCTGKSERSQVIIARKRDKNQLTNEEFGKRAKEEIRGAAVNAGVDRNGKRYTTHSGRKAYAQAQMDKYKSYSKNQLKKEVAKRCQDKKTKQKYDAVIKNIRKKITEGSKNEGRKLTNKEMCQFLVSLDLGHYRLDVVRYYADY
ncbi:TPA: tyrosine-type recombinase/integrase [Bacillus cereus]|nr:tyrosine-type recombinase/integrase [Bacillus cereus]TSI02252.1 tyrosine-type recombinase/integrase [Bacillus sp. HY001]HDX9500660.1 tyrosine-type recombinase/integrase [Bacillus thuringiensis]HDX9643604.1 tyrosine-type recombinase/integrase [Bacillus mobilis]HDR6479684.1 tyrosine-type recombinase/integrase [Bacillus cereus]